MSSQHIVVVAAKLVCLFVVVGGLVGGAITGVVMGGWYVWGAVVGGYFDWSSILFGPPLFIVTSLLGIMFGFPASLFTGVVYALSERVRRHSAIAIVGGASSAVCGLVVAHTASHVQPAAAVYLSFAGAYGVSGSAAAMSCHWLAVRWNFT